jgi:hypothetical protein
VGLLAIVLLLFGALIALLWVFQRQLIISHAAGHAGRRHRLTRR